MASENLGRIYYEVDIETGKLVASSNTAASSIDKLDQKLDQSEKSANNTAQSMTKLAKAIGAVIAASALRDMAQLVQSYQEMAERVQMATSSQAEFEMVQKRLLATANGTYRSLAEAQELYIRTADSLRSMGYSTAQALDITDSMSFAFVKNATSADRAAAATTALSKSINTGKVAADQWETVTAAIPSIINDIARASQAAGEPLEQAAARIRALGAAGKLTARDLSEGLRQSLDANAEAAAGMANNLTDAGVRSRTALTVMLVALEQQTGALQTFTNAIIQAADMVLEFAGDGGSMAAVLTTLELGATSLAAVLAGRMVAGLVASTQSLYAATLGANAKARADLSAAQAAATLAAQELIQAQAAERAAVGLSTHAAAATRLAAAQATATTATTNLAAAQTRVASTAGIATVAMTGLRNVMAFLGGPLGIALLAASALYTFTTNARDAKVPVDDLTKSVNELSDAQRRLAIEQAKNKIPELQADLIKYNHHLEEARKLEAKGATRGAEWAAEAAVQIEQANNQIDAYRKRLEELTNYQPEAPAAAGPLAAPTTSPEGQKRLQEMREEIELAKLSGEARARLQAIQRLGAEATDEERAEAEQLAATLFQLETAQKSKTEATKADIKESKKSTDEIRRAKEANVEAIAQLTTQLRLAGLSGRELVEAQAALKLNEYATPEQIEQAKSLAVQLSELEAIEKRRKSFGDTEMDITQHIRGDVTPLSGGQFDDQTARYEAEALAEQKRYAEAQTRLNEALELELVTKAEYQALELEMYQTHSDRLAQIDQARQEMQIQSWAQGFGQMSQDLQAFASTFADENSAMFKVAKAAAIAQAVMNTYQAATGAMASLSAIPIVGPALGIAAAAAAVAGGMAQVANIRSQSVPGRRYGGSVDANSMYQVNENGAPELLRDANGRQYLLPNTRGEVVSNQDARDEMGGGYGGGSVTVNQTIQVTGTVDRYTAQQLASATARQQRASQSRLGK